MRLIRALFCLAGIHTPESGVDPKWSVRWICVNCGEVRPGEIIRR